MANLLKVKEMPSFTAWKTVYQLEPLQKSNGSFCFVELKNIKDTQKLKKNTEKHT